MLTVDPAPAAAPERTGRTAAALSLTMLLNLTLILVFLDRAWIPPDDGHYAHVAHRLSGGEVLHRDVEELHPGAIHFIHAWALKWFGEDFLSLRYPLAAVVMLQSLIVFGLFRRWGVGRALVAATSVSALGAFQIANPTTSLYALFVTVALIALLSANRKRSSKRYFLIGALWMAVFLFRQLSAVFIGMGLLTYLLIEIAAPGEARAGGDEASPTWAPRVLLGVMIAGLAAYLAFSTDLFGLLFIGVWPLGVLILCWQRVSASAAELAKMFRDISCGAAIASLPLLAYHLVHGSTAFWLNDVFVRSLRVTDLGHIKVHKYFNYLYLGLDALLGGDSVQARINGIYWCVLPLLTMLLGAGVWHLLRKNAEWRDPRLLALPILTLFNSLVSLFNQIPYYLYLSCGLTLAALLWLSVLHSSRSKAPYIVAVALCLIGLYYHAGQPYIRSIPEIVSGVRYPLVESGLPRNGLMISPREAKDYRQLIKTIHTETGEGEPIFVFPNNAEIYFLADRPNPFRLFNPTLSLIDEGEVDAFVEELDAARPKLLVHGKNSAYNTELTERLLQGVMPNYDLLKEVGGFAVFRRVD